MTSSLSACSARRTNFSSAELEEAVHRAGGFGFLFVFFLGGEVGQELRFGETKVRVVMSMRHLRTSGERSGLENKLGVIGR